MATDVTTEKTRKGRSSLEIITLSSDEEASEEINDDGNFLFKRFILSCRPHVTKETIKVARSLFTEVQEKLIVSHDLVDLLKQYGKVTSKENAELHLRLFCNALNEKISGRSNSAVLEQVLPRGKTEVDRQDDQVPKGVTFCDVGGGKVFEVASKLSTNQNDPATSILEITTISDNDDFVCVNHSKNLKERNDNRPSTSGAYQNAKPDKTKRETCSETLSDKRHKKKLASRLKQRLLDISNEIKILNRAELTLEEMDMSDSAYMKENRLKKLFGQTWKKLCKLLGRQPNTGRVVEKPIRATSTGYVLIDKAVAKFLNEKCNSFPDYFDIRDTVMKANQKHDLRMSPQVLSGLIADIFTDIGNKLQRRRRRDLLFNFGSYLLDDFKAEDDPALVNDDLAKQLERNSQISKRNMKQVFTKYTHLERYEIDDKSKRSGVKETVNYESGTSDEEQDDHRIVKGSISKSGLFTSRQEMDMITESTSSEHEQDMSMTNKDELTVADSDVSTLQDISFVRPTPKLLTKMSLPTSDSRQSLTSLQRFNSNDYQIMNIPNSNLVTAVNKPFISKNKANSGYECEMPSRETGQVKMHKMSDDSVNKPSVSNKEASSDANCEIVDDPKEHFVSHKKMFLKKAPEEQYVNQQQASSDDSLIVVDDKENPPTMTETINSLQKVHIKQSDPVDQAKFTHSLCNQLKETVEGVVCSNEDCSIKGNFTESDVNFKSGLMISVSQTNASKACGKSSINLVKGVASYNDVTISDHEKCLTAHSPKNSKDCPLLGTDRFTTSVNIKKRKASVELDVEIPRSSVKCLEQIACSLRNKKLKLPDSWVNSSQESSPKKCLTGKGNVSALPKPTTSKAQSNVTQTLCKNNSHDVDGKRKINLQHRQVFREKTLNALKVVLKTDNNSVNEILPAADACSSTKTALNNSVTASDSLNNLNKHDVIIIDD